MPQIFSTCLRQSSDRSFNISALQESVWVAAVEGANQVRLRWNMIALRKRCRLK